MSIQDQTKKWKNHDFKKRSNEATPFVVCLPGLGGNSSSHVWSRSSLPSPGQGEMTDIDPTRKEWKMQCLGVSEGQWMCLDIMWLTDFANLVMALPWTQAGRFPDPSVDLSSWQIKGKRCHIEIQSFRLPLLEMHSCMESEVTRH